MGCGKSRFIEANGLRKREPRRVILVRIACGRRGLPGERAVKVSFGVVVLLAALGAGCAGVRPVSFDRQDVWIASDPPGATVTTANLRVMTPGTLTLNPQVGHELTITKDGYAPKRVVLQSTPKGQIRIPDGSGVFKTVYGLEPSTVQVTLDPVQPGRLRAQAPPPAVTEPPRASPGLPRRPEGSEATPHPVKERLRILKEIREENLITEQQYQEAVREVLKKLIE